MSKRHPNYNPHWRADTPEDAYPYVYIGSESPSEASNVGTAREPSVETAREPSVIDVARESSVETARELTPVMREDSPVQERAASLLQHTPQISRHGTPASAVASLASQEDRQSSKEPTPASREPSAASRELSPPPLRRSSRLRQENWREYVSPPLPSRRTIKPSTTTKSTARATPNNDPSPKRARKNSTT